MTTQTATTRKKVRARRLHGDPAHWFHELLSFDQERVLIERARDGDRAARDELILKNQRLIVHIAKRSLGGFHELGDLVSAGNRGLIRAVERFDPARGVRFANYAVRWIRSMIQSEIRNTGQPIRVSSWAVNLVATYRKAEKRLRTLEGVPPGFARVCEAMRLTAGQQRCLAHALGVAEAEFVPCDAEPRLTTREPAPEHAAEEEEFWDRVERLIGRLTPRQAGVLRLHFGLGDESGLSLVEISRREGTTWQAVQNSRNRALDRLRMLARVEGLQRH